MDGSEVFITIEVCFSAKLFLLCVHATKTILSKIPTTVWYQCHEHAITHQIDCLAQHTFECQFININISYYRRISKVFLPLSRIHVALIWLRKKPRLWNPLKLRRDFNKTMDQIHWNVHQVHMNAIVSTDFDFDCLCPSFTKYKHHFNLSVQINCRFNSLLFFVSKWLYFDHGKSQFCFESRKKEW